MVDTGELLSQQLKPPLYRDATVIKWVSQCVTLACLVAVLYFLGSQAGSNLQAKSIDVNYDFLTANQGFGISEGIDTQPATGGRALWVGMVNTLRVSAAGIISASILGLFIGVGRLSTSWLVRRVTSVYVEMMRNIPLLVQIYIIYAVFLVLPDLATTQGGPSSGLLFLSNEGLSVPRVHISDGFYQWMIFVLLGVVAGVFVKRWRQQQQDITGINKYPLEYFVLVLTVFCVVGWRLNPIFGWLSIPLDTVSQTIMIIPAGGVQIALSLSAVCLTSWWIKRSVDRLRTPAGFAKLTDNDYFSIIFTAFLCLAFILGVTLVWPGFASWIINSGSDLFQLLADKFGGERSSFQRGSSPPFDIQYPEVVEVGKFLNYGDQGLNLSISLAAVYFGVVLYTSAFIAEIVRSGIIAVPKGQIEAAQAVGLRRSAMLRLIIIPQALRVILPPLGNQYLNLTKNTSLGIAVAYSELVQIGQTIYNQNGSTLAVLSIWMLFYLACSLAISTIVNFFNIRLKIVTR